MPHKIQNLCVIRNVEYHLSLSFSESAKERDAFIMDALNTVTQRCWRGVFDSDLISRLTSQAGSLKPFTSFVAMIKAAILKTSRSVCLDIVSQDGLSRRRGKSLEVLSKQQDQNPRRIYMILTYQTEFEECRYPLPLDLREVMKSKSEEIQRRGGFYDSTSPDEFNHQKIALVEFQIEVKSLRKENQKLREALIDERSSRKEFEQRINKQRDNIHRNLESQLSTERSDFQRELQRQTRQSNLLTKNLTLAKRENDSLRIQVRRLQAENGVYKRNLTIRPSASEPARVSQSKSSITRSRTDLQDGKVSGKSREKLSQYRPYRDLSTSLTRRDKEFSHVEPREEKFGIQKHNYTSGFLRNHSAEHIGRPYNDGGNLNQIQRSRSYSPQFQSTHRKPAFSIVKTLNRSNSIVSDSRCSTPSHSEFHESRENFISDTRYSRRRNRPLYGSPVRRKETDVLSTGSSQKLSFRRVRSRDVGPRSPSSFVRRNTPERRRTQLSPARKPYDRIHSPTSYGHGDSWGSHRAGNPDLKKPLESHDVKVGQADKSRSRNVSPAELLVQKYKDGRAEQPDESHKAEPGRRPSLNGAKFRDLLARLQGLGEEFPDSLATSPR